MLVSPTSIQSLEQWYTFRNREEVISFLEHNPFLVPLLQEAYDKIGMYFPQPQVFLEVVCDPEAPDDPELFALIATDLDADEAVDRLEQLDDEWWLDVSDQGQNKLNIHLEF